MCTCAIHISFITPRFCNLCASLGGWFLGEFSGLCGPKMPVEPLVAPDAPLGRFFPWRRHRKLCLSRRTLSLYEKTHEKIRSSSFIAVHRRQEAGHMEGRTASRAFFQYACSVEWRARWLFLKEKATRHPAFALHQLEKCSRICQARARRLRRFRLARRRRGCRPLPWRASCRLPCPVRR